MQNEQSDIGNQIKEIKDQNQYKASEKTLSIYFQKMARSVQRELGSRPSMSAEKMQEESVFGEVYQSEESKNLQDSADLLSKKLEIIGLNIIDMKKFKVKTQKQIQAIEQEKE